MKDDLLDAKESALRSYNRFLNYFGKALEIIENADYVRGEDILRKLPEQAKEQIFGGDKDKNYYSQIEEFSRDLRDFSLAKRALYLSRVVDYLKETSKSPKYNPSNGSFWEDIGQTLEELALEVQEKL
jgi:hypothetical protein